MVMNVTNRIEINPKVLVGKPVIRGTRIPVSLILNLLAHDYSVDRILSAYPNLKKADIAAAIQYSEMRLNRETIQPLTLVRR